MAKAKQPEVEGTAAPEVPTQEPELQWESVEDSKTGAIYQRLVSGQTLRKQETVAPINPEQVEAIRQQTLANLSDEELLAYLAERKAQAEAAKKASEGQA